MKKIFSVLFFSILTTVVTEEKVLASDKIYSLNGASISIDNKKIQSNEPPLSINGRVLVPIRVVSQHMSGEVHWDNSKKKVTVITENRDVMEMNTKQKNILINGIKYDSDVNLILHQNRVYLPIRLTAELNHAQVHYVNGNVSLQKISLHIVKKNENIYQIANKYGASVEEIITRNGLADEEVIRGQQLKVVVPYVIKLETDKVQLLAKLIESEAKGESSRGKLAVGNVVVNRVNSPKFPNSVKEVIYQKNQFSPVKTGKINKIKASVASIEAAKKALGGQNVVKDALYFYNPKKTNSTFFNKLKVIMKIENHTFLK